MTRFFLPGALILALALGTATLAQADPNGPAPAAADHAPGPMPGDWGPGPGPGGPGPDFPHPGGGPGGWGDHRDDKFGLFAQVPDKHLSVADVKIIATAILLEHGNHDWTVTNVAAQADKSIEFSFATGHGDIVATFAVDPASGRLKRIG